MEINIDTLGGLNKEDFDRYFIHLYFKQHNLMVAENATLSNFRITSLGSGEINGSISFSGVVQYGDRVIEFNRIRAMKYVLLDHNNAPVNSAIYIDAGVNYTEQLGFRIIQFELYPSGGNIIIQSVETREIMGFMFPLCEDTHSRLQTQNITTEQLGIGIGSRLLNLTRNNFLPRLEQEFIPTSD